MGLRRDPHTGQRSPPFFVCDLLTRDVMQSIRLVGQGTTASFFVSLWGRLLSLCMFLGPSGTGLKSTMTVEESGWFHSSGRVTTGVFE